MWMKSPHMRAKCLSVCVHVLSLHVNYIKRHDCKRQRVLFTPSASLLGSQMRILPVTARRRFILPFHTVASCSRHKSLLQMRTITFYIVTKTTGRGSRGAVVQYGLFVSHSWSCCVLLLFKIKGLIRFLKRSLC